MANPPSFSPLPVARASGAQGLARASGAQGLARASGARGLARGWDPKSFSGRKADYFVDCATDASGEGTSPATAFRTVGEAIARVAADGVPRTVAVCGDGAIYRERISLAGCDGLTLRGYGTDKPTITGQEMLTGWVRCTRADAAVLGPNWTSIWKTTVADSALAVDARAINLYEGDAAVPVCQVRRPGADLFFRTYDASFVRADRFALDASNQITAITDGDVLSGLGAADLVGQAYAFVYAHPNTVGLVSITSFDGVATVGVDGLLTVHGNKAAPDPDHFRWNLANCLPTMVQGTHGTADNGDGTTTIYLWPRDVANLASAVSYAARSEIIGAPDVRDVTIEGLRLIGTAGNARKNGHCVRTERSSNVTVRHCLLGDLTHSAGGYGAVWAQQTTNFRLERCDIRNIDGAFTAFLQQGPNDVWSHGSVVRQNRCYRLSQTAFRFYGQRNVQMVFNDVDHSGYGGHSNAWNFYMGCDTILVYGNKFRNLLGYGTWQDSSNIFIGMNLQQQSLSEKDNRAIQDQMRPKKTSPKPGSTNYLWNNQIIPDPNDLETTTSVSLGRPWSAEWGGPDSTHPFNNRFVFINNIVHGGGISGPYKKLRDGEDRWGNRPGFGPAHVERMRAGNLYTGLTYWQNPSEPYLWARHRTEVIYLGIHTVYANPDAGDFRAPPESPILTHRGVGLDAVLDAARAAFPDFDFTVDCDGLPIGDLAAPRVGCFQNDYNAQIVG
jgi:hypothetical protein